MIIGFLKEVKEEEDPEYYREEMYRHELDMFEGVPYTYHGITDELDHLSKLIEVIGESVLTQEKDFKILSEEEEAAERAFPTDKMIDNWHKKTYRSFSYKALLTVIHGVFERGLTDLYRILKESGRITFEIKNDKLMDVLKQYKILDTALEPLVLQVWPYNFIRNKIIHSDGYFTKSDKGYQEFEKFIKSRNDVEVKERTSPKGQFSHRIIIKQSTVLKDYIILIREIFKSVITAARNARYMEPPAS